MVDREPETIVHAPGIAQETRLGRILWPDNWVPSWSSSSSRGPFLRMELIEGIARRSRDRYICMRNDLAPVGYYLHSSVASEPRTHVGADDPRLLLTERVLMQVLSPILLSWVWDNYDVNNKGSHSLTITLNRSVLVTDPVDFLTQAASQIDQAANTKLSAGRTA